VSSLLDASPFLGDHTSAATLDAAAATSRVPFSLEAASGIQLLLSSNPNPNPNPTPDPNPNPTPTPTLTPTPFSGAQLLLSFIGSIRPKNRGYSFGVRHG